MGCPCSKLCSDEESPTAQPTSPPRVNVVRQQPSPAHVANAARISRNVNNTRLQKSVQTSERNRLIQPINQNVRDIHIQRITRGYGAIQSNNQPIRNNIIKARHILPPVKVAKNTNIFNIECDPYFDSLSVVNFTYLSRADSEYQMILDKVTNKRKFKIDHIKRVENPYLKKAYQLKKEQKRREYPDFEERLLFHGTKRTNLESICKFNFNWRLCTSHRIGKGVFFSPNAMYASNYSDKDEYGKVMIVANVLIGKTCNGNGKMMLPDRGCDTCKKGDDEIVIVKYEDNEFCPVYVITYHLDNTDADRSRSNSRQRLNTKMGCLCSKEDESLEIQRSNVVCQQPSVSSSVNVTKNASNYVNNTRKSVQTSNRQPTKKNDSNNSKEIRHTLPPIKVARNPAIFDIQSDPYFSSSSVVSFTELSRADYDYQMILKKVTNKRNFKIERIEKVENPYLKKAYELKKEQKEREYLDLKEQWLFHGTKLANVESICKFNFDWRLCKSHKFGKGISFSPNAMYASNYSDEDEYRKVMIVANVLIGNTCFGHENMIVPDRGCDTSKKGDDGIVIVKYEDNEFYPVFVITYHLANMNVEKGVRSRSNSRQRNTRGVQSRSRSNSRHRFT